MTDHAARRTQSARTLLRWTGRLLALGVALVVLGAVVVVAVIPRATHGAAMTVLTGSMTPGIPVGSVVLVRPVDPGTLRVGDVATYQAEPGKATYITHRVAKIDTSTTPTSFVFKGDANRGADVAPVGPKQIRGKVWFHVPVLGAVRDGLHGRGGITLVVTLLLAGYALSQVSGGLRERRDAAGSPADGDEPAGPRVEVPVDRPLVAATLEVDRLASRLALTPAEAATAWSGLLVHEDAGRCTLLLTPAADGLGASLQLLDSLHAEVLVVEAPGVLATRAARHRPSTPPAHRQATGRVPA